MLYVEMSYSLSIPFVNDDRSTGGYGWITVPMVHRGVEVLVKEAPGLCHNVFRPLLFSSWSLLSPGYVFHVSSLPHGIYSLLLTDVEDGNRYNKETCADYINGPNVQSIWDMRSTSRIVTVYTTPFTHGYQHQHKHIFITWDHLVTFWRSSRWEETRWYLIRWRG